MLEFNMNKTGSIASMHRYHIMYNESWDGTLNNIPFEGWWIIEGWWTIPGSESLL